MSKNDCLNLKHNLNIAQIFLNTFGLVLGDTKEADAFSQIKIFDQSKDEVGELTLTNDKIIISANYDNSVLNANFDFIKLRTLTSEECEAGSLKSWVHKINFQLQTANHLTISGVFAISCSAEPYFGISGLSCQCHPIINCEIPGKGQIILKILIGGSLFKAEFVSEKHYEEINVMPWNDLCGFIWHDIKKESINYRKYAGIFTAGKDNKNKLHVFLMEEENNQVLNYKNEFPDKVGEDYSDETLLQIGQLMQDLDPNMYEKIQKLRELFTIGNISLLDNLFSVCYDKCTDEELNSILGVHKQKLNYQNGADNLVDACFETGTKESLSSEIVTRLLKK